MTTVTITTHAAVQNGPKRKVTCLTCKLKKCVGHCRFEVVSPRAA